MGSEPIMTGEMLKHGSETPAARDRRVSVEIPESFGMCFSADWLVGHLASQFFNFGMDKPLFPWPLGPKLPYDSMGCLRGRLWLCRQHKHSRAYRHRRDYIVIQYALSHLRWGWGNSLPATELPTVLGKVISCANCLTHAPNETPAESY